MNSLQTPTLFRSQGILAFTPADPHFAMCNANALTTPAPPTQLLRSHCPPSPPRRGSPPPRYPHPSNLRPTWPRRIHPHFLPLGFQPPLPSLFMPHPAPLRSGSITGGAPLRAPNSTAGAVEGRGGRRAVEQERQGGAGER